MRKPPTGRRSAASSRPTSASSSVTPARRGLRDEVDWYLEGHDTPVIRKVKPRSYDEMSSDDDDFKMELCAPVQAGRSGGTCSARVTNLIDFSECDVAVPGESLWKGPDHCGQPASKPKYDTVETTTDADHLRMLLASVEAERQIQVEIAQDEAAILRQQLAAREEEVFGLQQEVTVLNQELHSEKLARRTLQAELDEALDEARSRASQEGALIVQLTDLVQRLEARVDMLQAERHDFVLKDRALMEAQQVIRDLRNTPEEVPLSFSSPDVSPVLSALSTPIWSRRSQALEVAPAQDLFVLELAGQAGAPRNRQKVLDWAAAHDALDQWKVVGSSKVMVLVAAQDHDHLDVMYEQLGESLGSAPQWQATPVRKLHPQGLC
mmetsp:Transcript_28031/g.72474  ORF Transcript_28031/g.72474 Transcript_28031/m.72474 type:complete len:380 (-) Transcript_28031:528-1667(-)